MQERARKLACAHQGTTFLRMKLEMCASKVNFPWMMQERACSRRKTCRQPFPPLYRIKHDAQARKLACAHQEKISLIGYYAQLHEERDGRPAAANTARTLPVLVPLCFCSGTKQQRLLLFAMIPGTCRIESVAF
jgi:hypothetical protein